MWSEGELHVRGSERGSGLSRSCFRIFVVGDALLEGSSLLSPWRRMGDGAADERVWYCPCALTVRPASLRRLPVGEQALGFLGHRQSVIYGTELVV